MLFSGRIIGWVGFTGGNWEYEECVCLSVCVRVCVCVRVW